jgi:DNA-directed RNA polymerase specialized sigma subunit
VKEYVKRIKKIDTMLKNKAFEIRQAEEIGLPCEQEKQERNDLQIERGKIIKAIEQLPEAEYDVLHKVYVQHETLQEVAGDRNISYSLASTIHGRALKRLENIVKGNNTV